MAQASNNNNEPTRIKSRYYSSKSSDKRKSGADESYLRWPKMMSVFGWILMFTAIVNIYIAKPGPWFDRKQVVANPNSWDYSQVRITPWILYLTVLVGALGLFMNSMKTKRKGDQYLYSLIFLEIFAVLGVLIYHFKFGFIL